MDRLGRIVAAGLVVAGGAIHVKLYNDGYRKFPNANLGRSFLLNAAGALVVAVLLVAWRTRWSLLLAIGLVDATLVGFALSRTSSGIFGFTETGFSPSPEAALALVVEIGAAVVLTGLLARALPRRAGQAVPTISS